MRTPLVLSLILAAVIPGSAVAQSYKLTRTAFSSGGGVMPGASLSLGMSAGLSVTGMAAGPAGGSPKTFAETVGFWIWGHLPVIGVGDPGDHGGVFSEFSLSQNAPNPFGPRTTMRYAIPTSNGPTVVSIRLYDLSGRLVRMLDSGPKAPGMYTLTWDGRNDDGHHISEGIYFCRMDAGSFRATRRLVMIR